MPLDSWMPTWDVRSIHHIDVNATPEVLYDALNQTDFGRNPLVRILMGLRAVPAFVLAPRRSWARCREDPRAANPSSTGGLLRGAFALLETRPPLEVTYGLTGRFWTPAGGLVSTDPGTFHDRVAPGLARATWHFQLQPCAGGYTRLSTETRVVCADPATRKSFLRYWRLIRPGSGLIRWALLRQVKRTAESAAVRRNNHGG